MTPEIPDDLSPDRKQQLASILNRESAHRSRNLPPGHATTTFAPMTSGYPNGRWPLSFRNAQRQTKAKARRETQKLLADHPAGPPST